MGRIVKCEGRFSDLRNYLYGEVFPTVEEDFSYIDEGFLKDAWELVKDEVQGYDFRDPYFHSVQNSSVSDSLRKPPVENHLSLVPLIESTVNVDNDLIEKYLLSMGVSKDVSGRVAQMGNAPRKFLYDYLNKDPKNVIISDDGKNFGGYTIQGNFGIGTISYGGAKGGGVRSDSPFLLEVYKKEEGSEVNLAGVVGFWVQDDSLLVSQMQPCRNARMPEDVPFGVSCIRLAEEVAKGVGLEKVLAYNARGHPIFKEHQNNWSQLGADFTCIWDNSLKKLGYKGSRNSCYEKKV